MNSRYVAYYIPASSPLQTHCKGTIERMEKMNQVDKMAIVATMAKMAFQVDSLLYHGCKVNQFESIKSGMSSKKVSENEKSFRALRCNPKIKLNRYASAYG